MEQIRPTKMIGEPADGSFFRTRQNTSRRGKSGVGCSSGVGERMISVLMGLNDYSRNRPNPTVSFSGCGERRFIELDDVRGFFLGGVFYGLSDHPSMLIHK